MTGPLPNFSIDLSGRVALVTGASSGLGWRFGEVLAACGAKVALAGRREEKLQDLAGRIEARGGKALAVPLDVSRAEDIAGAADAIETALGRIDILINNAGVSESRRAVKLAPEQVDQIIDTNLRGPWHLSCAVARRLIDAGAPGRIVNIASMGAYHFAGKTATGLYSVTKAGILRMTEVMAEEWSRFGINVNAIAPGGFQSEMTDGLTAQIGDDWIRAFPRARLGRPDQLDSTLLYLVSPSSDFVTGTCIKVDDAQFPR